MPLIRRVNRSDCKESHIFTGLLQRSFTELQDFLFSPVNVLTFQRNETATMLVLRCTFPSVESYIYCKPIQRQEWVPERVLSIFLGKVEENRKTLDCWTPNKVRQRNAGWGERRKLPKQVLHLCLCSTAYAWAVDWTLLNSVLMQFYSLELATYHVN